MRSWVPCAGLVAVGLAIPAFVAGCGQNSFNDCTANGTCPADSGGDGPTEETVLVEASGGDSNGGDGGDDATDAAADVESGATCDGASSLPCSGGCVNPTQPAHCGTCDNACAAPETGVGHATCTAGVCGVGCDPEGGTPLDCSGACVDPTQPAHCGACTNACAAPPSGQGTATCTAPMTCGVSCNGGHHWLQR